MRTYHLQNYNYTLMDNAKKETFTEKYINIFDILSDDEAIVLTASKDKIFFSFIGSEEHEAVTAVKFRELTGNISEISTTDTKELKPFESENIATAVCSFWRKDISDDIISCLISEGVTVRVLVTKLPKKKASHIKGFKGFKTKDNERSGNKTFSYHGIEEDLLELKYKNEELRKEIMALENNLYRIKLEVTAFGENTDEAVKKLDKIISKAKSYGIELNKIKKDTSIGTFGIFKSMEDGVCRKDIIGKLIPFTVAECNNENGINYGINVVSGNPIVFDRKYSRLPHGLIVSKDKVQRTRLMWNEINQIKDDTNNSILIIDPFNYSKDKNKEIKKIICFGKDSKYHINPLDCYYDDFHDDGICEVSETVISFFEGVFGRSLNAYEVNALHAAVYEIMSPFIAYLKENNLTHDFEKNPTLNDLFKALKKEHEASKNFHKKQIELSEKIKGVLCEAADSELEDLVSEINEILEGPKVKGMDYKLYEDIEAHKDKIECFCFTTNIPDDINICLTLDDDELNHGIAKSSLSVFIRYVFLRTVINHEKAISDTQNDLGTWIFIEDVSEWFSMDLEKAVLPLLKLIKRSRILGGIVTICISSLYDILSNYIGASVINNTILQRIGSLDYNSNKKAKEIFGFSEREMGFVDENTVLFYDGRSAIPCKLSE